MKSLLITTAVLELAAGVLLSAFPSIAGMLLLGSALDGAGLAIARIGGAALLALGVACWLARQDHQSRAARALVTGMLVYNAGVVFVCMYAAAALTIPLRLLWPALLVHAVMSVWCVTTLVKRPMARAGEIAYRA